MEPFLGEIRMISCNFAPKGWALCIGQFLPIATNQALFSIIGTTYGGDGRVSFALPDFRGRLPIHVGPSNPLGAKGGTETNTLTVQNMPAHTHAASATPVKCLSVVSTSDYSTSFPANSGTDFSYSASAGATEFAADGAVTTVAALVGANQPVNNMMPSLGINFIIAINGIFPSLT